jgi:uncharacterized membrane protein YvbJ
MFCPKCGKSDQKPETYCRQCGMFLVDFDKPTKKPITPQQHLTVNSTLSLMTAIVSLTLAILLYSIFLGRADTHIIIYVTAGFLTAMCAWQVQTFWRTLLLKKHFKQPKDNIKAENESVQLYEKPRQTNKLLDEADFSNIVPPGIVENTTKQLKQKIVK